MIETWSLGSVSVDVLSPQTAAYVAGYVTRKVISEESGTRCPPFMRMSNGGRTGKGGIGASAMHDVASTVLKYDLPIGRVMVGRYLRRKLSEFTAQPVPDYVPSAAVRAVFETAYENGTSAKALFREIWAPHASQLAQRDKLRGKVL